MAIGKYLLFYSFSSFPILVLFNKTASVGGPTATFVCPIHTETIANQFPTRKPYLNTSKLYSHNCQTIEHNLHPSLRLLILRYSSFRSEIDFMAPEVCLS